MQAHLTRGERRAERAGDPSILTCLRGAQPLERILEYAAGHDGAMRV